MGTYLKYLFQLILSPGHGWEDVANAAIHPKVIAAKGFYPLTAITALSVFARKLSHTMLGLQELIGDAIVTFVMYFLGYFIAAFVLSVGIGSIIPGEPGERRCHTFALFIIGMLELIAILGNLVSITMPITWFMPVYVAVVMWKGAGFLDVERAHAGRFMMLTVPGVLLPPYILMLLFTMILK